MGDNKNKQDNQNNLNNDDLNNSSYSGQKGGQAQSDFNDEDFDPGIANDPTRDTSLSDEDL